jgi:hypothetical protein
MRYGCAALLMLMSSAVMVSAQGDVSVTARTVDVSGGPLGFAAQKVEPKVSPDLVVARVMLFDRNGDGKVATTELSERMQVIVARGDTSGDGALDNSEIQALALRRLEFVPTAQRNRQFGFGGGYSFGDTVGLSSRSHIQNTIEDLRLAPHASEEARRIASTFADELEATALANLRNALAAILTDVQLAEFETNLKRGAGTRTIRFASNDGTPPQTQTLTVAADPTGLLRRYQLSPEQMKTATAAVETFKTDQQLDDARRSALVTRLSGILTVEERDNFRAALARRPIVQAAGFVGGVVGGIGPVEALNQLRNAVSVTTPRP